MGVKLPFNDIGPCDVVWDYGEPGEYSLGPYVGQVKLAAEDQIVKVFEESLGDTAVDAVNSGMTAELTVPLTRSTLQQLEHILPGVTLDVNGNLVFRPRCGSAMYSAAKAIVIKPVENMVPVADVGKWIMFYKCYPYKSLEIPFDRSSQRTHLLKFLVFPNMDSGFSYEMWQYGVHP